MAKMARVMSQAVPAKTVKVKAITFDETTRAGSACERYSVMVEEFSRLHEVLATACYHRLQYDGNVDRAEVDLAPTCLLYGTLTLSFPSHTRTRLGRSRWVPRPEQVNGSQHRCSSMMRSSVWALVCLRKPNEATVKFRNERNTHRKQQKNYGPRTHTISHETDFWCRTRGSERLLSPCFAPCMCIRASNRE